MWYIPKGGVAVLGLKGAAREERTEQFLNSQERQMVSQREVNQHRARVEAENRGAVMAVQAATGEEQLGTKSPLFAPMVGLGLGSALMVGGTLHGKLKINVADSQGHGSELRRPH